MQREEPRVYGNNGIDLQGIQETLAALRGQKKTNQNKTANDSSGLVKTVLDKKLHVKSEDQITTVLIKYRGVIPSTRKPESLGHVSWALARNREWKTTIF